MFKTMLKIIRQEIELREEVAKAIEALDDFERLHRQVGSITIQATTTTSPRKPRKKTKTKRATPDRAEKDKRNAKARAAYLAKHPPKGRADDSMTHRESTTTTSRLQALPSKPTSIGRGRPEGGKRARTSAAVIATLKRSPSPLTLEEIDTDLEKTGWPYKGRDRKGAIRATLTRLKASGTVSTFLRGSGIEAMQMFRLERTNGEVTTPVEQALSPPPTGEIPFTREEQAEVEDSEQAALADEARADAEGDPDALDQTQTRFES